MAIETNPPHRAKIACFHGGGSTSTIFQIQCERLQYLLKTTFEFVFFEAPFVSAPGTDVMPAFKSYAPFKAWFKKDEAGVEIPDGSGYDSIGRDGIERVWSMMMQKGSPGEYVGAMGFSQGTRVASGLLLDQQRRREAGARNGFDLKFAVLCMGSRAPMQSEMSYVYGGSRARDLIRTPTLHVHGLKDKMLMGGREQMKSYFQPGTTVLYEIDYHHAMPWVTAEVTRLADLMKRMYEETKDY